MYQVPERVSDSTLLWHESYTQGQDDAELRMGGAAFAADDLPIVIFYPHHFAPGLLLWVGGSPRGEAIRRERDTRTGVSARHVLRHTSGVVRAVRGQGGHLADA